MTSGAVVRDSTTQRLEVFIKGSYEKIKDEFMGKLMGNYSWTFFLDPVNSEFECP